jgi:glycosyltransferase involved in cell wall biosynthesis
MVSVIIPSYNKELYISESISSVLNQSYSELELIIIDDHSTDATSKLISEFNDSRIIFRQNDENRGANYCRNAGLKIAGGEYIVFLDADDILTMDCLKNRVSFMERNRELDFAVYTLEVFYDNIGDTDVRWFPMSRNALIDFLKHDLPWQTMQPIWKKEFLLSIGGFDESFTRMQDVELHTRALLASNVRFKSHCTSPDCYFRVNENRKNFSTFSFLKKWTLSSIEYCDKFSHLVSPAYVRFLLGTVFQTYYQLLYHFKRKEIGSNDFRELEKLLLTQGVLKGLKTKKLILKFTRFYNLHFIRIPGVNRLLKRMIVR